MEVGTPPRSIEQSDTEPITGADNQLSSFNIEPRLENQLESETSASRNTFNIINN